MTTNIRPRKCRACGRVFPGGPRAWYCPACRIIKQQEYRRRTLARQKAGTAVKVGISRRKCEICGEEYIVQSPVQRYCKHCAKDAVKAVDAPQGLAYYRKNKAQINEKRNIKRRKPPKIHRCVICGNIMDTRTNKSVCSPQCKKRLFAIYYQRADYKRGRRKQLPEEIPYKRQT